MIQQIIGVKNKLNVFMTRSGKNWLTQEQKSEKISSEENNSQREKNVNFQSKLSYSQW